MIVKNYCHELITNVYIYMYSHAEVDGKVDPY